MHIVGVVAALVLGLTFIVSGVIKLRDPEAFVFGVLEYDVLPSHTALVYARVVPVVELAAGVALLAGVLPVASGAALLALLTTFVAGVGINLARGRHLDCQCFGSNSGERLGWVTVLRIVILGCAATVVVVRPPEAIWAYPPQQGIPMAALGAAVLLLIYLMRAAPVQWEIWRTKVSPSMTRQGCLSLRDAPLRGLFENRLENRPGAQPLKTESPV